MAKWVSLIVKFGALVFIVFVPTNYAIQLQLLGGIWIIQTLPAVMLGVYTRWFNDWALLIGWAVGTVAGTAMAVSVNFAAAYPLAIGGYTLPGYSAFYTVIVNLVIAIVLTPVFNAMGGKRSTPPCRPITTRHKPGRIDRVSINDGAAKRRRVTEEVECPGSKHGHRLRTYAVSRSRCRRRIPDPLRHASLRTD